MTRGDWLLTFLGVERDFKKELPPEAWPTGMAPFIRLNETGKRMAEAGHFGLLPHFAKEVAYGRRTYNARSETVAKLASFRDAWRKGQRCIIPAEAVYEPCWESGKAVRWEIFQSSYTPLGIAGIFNTWRDFEGNEHNSFAMLTVNGDGHPIFQRMHRPGDEKLQRMHRPGDEKRMVVILRDDEYDDWLTCSVDEAPRYFRQFAGKLQAEPKPLPPRTRIAAEPVRGVPSEDPGLF